MLRIIAVIFISILLSACSNPLHLSIASPAENQQSLNGLWGFTTQNSSKEEYDTQARVPNNWFLNGVDYAGIAKYHHQFNLSPVLLKERRNGARLWLNFEAVDYFADVYLNGESLGHHTGYFAPFNFEVTGQIADYDNDLKVIVDSPNEADNEDWSLHKTLIKGVLNHHDTRPGGAWSKHGQDNNSGGIWGNVALKATGDVAIVSVKFVPNIENVKDTLTSAKVVLTLNSNVTRSINLQLQLFSEGNIKERELYNKSITVTEGNQEVVWSVPVKKRQLWWPWDWGEPALYSMNISAMIDGTISDSYQDKVGFRKFEFNEERGTFFVNEFPYFIRGTNYIGSQWLASMNASDYAQDLELIKAANINSIRVHAHVAGKSFYKLADEMGILIWQDFPLQWGYSDSIAFQIEAVKQTKEMTDMLFNHASIAFWSGHNEPPWDATWMQYKYKSYSKSQNVALTEAVYQQLLDANDGRIARKASYTKEHPWFGWYSLTYQDYKKKPAAPIISEFGAQALPKLSVIQNMIGNDNAWPLSQNTVKKLKYHNYQPHETLHIAKIELGQSVSQFIKNSQEYQRVVIKYAIEQLRLNKHVGLAGIYQFMFVDSWPSITWSVLDYLRNEKPGYNALKQSYQPLLPIVVKESSDSSVVSVFYVNDSRIKHQDVTLKIIDKTHGISWVLTGLDIESNSKKKILNKQMLTGLTENFDVSLFDSKGILLAKNSYTLMD